MLPVDYTNGHSSPHILLSRSTEREATTISRLVSSRHLDPRVSKDNKGEGEMELTAYLKHIHTLHISDPIRSLSTCHPQGPTLRGGGAVFDAIERAVQRQTKHQVYQY